MDSQRIIDLLIARKVDFALEVSKPFFGCIQSMAPTDVAYFEPRMHIDSGHFGRLASIYSTKLSEAGFTTSVFHRHEQTANGRDNWHGIFPVPDHVAGLDKITTYGQLQAFTNYFEHIFGECLSGSGARIAIFATSRFLTMPAAVNAVEKAPGLNGAIFGVMESYPVPDCNDREMVEGAFRSAAEQIENSAKSYLVFVESKPIRDFLIDCGFSSKRVFVNPYPAAHRFQEPRNRTTGLSRPRMGNLGGTREVQNPGLMAAYLLESEKDEFDWTVRLNLELAARHCSMEISEIRDALLGKNINLIEDRLSDTEYDLALKSLDIMLLPYGDRYQTIGSGIFLECICAGVIPLVPKDSTMRLLYEELGGRAPAIEVLSVEGIEQAVLTVLPDLKDLLENRYRVRDAWLRHDQGPITWSRRVQEFLL
jgi:hypothetical protein